ncbi:MAG: hypothetical protein NVSMB18_34800 [Acetobacteraceae bacterium]
MRIARLLLTGTTILLLGAAPVRQAGTPVPLQSQPGTPLDAAARSLVAEDLAAAQARGEKPLLLTGSARLGGDRPALFVQLQAPRECGSAGCTTAVYAWVHGAWSRVLDGSTGRLAVATTHTRGMADLLTDGERYVWTGTTYRSTHPAPAVDLRPRRPRPHGAS